MTTHSELMEAVRAVRQAALDALEDVKCDEWLTANDRLHKALEGLCDAIGMDYPRITRNAAGVGKSGVQNGLNVVASSCDAFLRQSTKETLGPKVAPLTLDQWADVQGAELAKGLVQLLAFALGSPLLLDFMRARNEHDYN